MTVKEKVEELNKQLLRFYDPAWELDLPESDNGINGASRAIIAEMGKAGAAWLGNVNLYEKTRNKPILWEWDRGMVYNSGAAFVVPAYDAELEQMIRERDDALYTGTKDDAPRVQAILDRVEGLGGVSLIWT